jgi:PTS system mannitol-specific IIC component
VSMALPVPVPVGTGWRAKVQRFGGFLAGMVIPNISAILAWGLITAFVIPTGWTPNAKLAQLVGPLITYLLPILIGYTGGYLIYGQRGAVVGAIATAGLVVGASIPMFLGAMIMGPLGGFLIKQFDNAIQPRIPSGFEMLINNFSAGILGAGLAILAFWAIGPAVQHASNALGDVVKVLVNHTLLPLVSIIVEPAKVLFLNNAINHGVLAPLGVAEAAKHGKAIHFMIESNPGPGLGLLTAYWLFGPRSIRPTAPGAIIIHFLGGIHEVYFPYVLMRPILILAMIAGGMSAVLTFLVTHAGLVATPSPGSIFAYLAETPKGGYFGVLAGVVVGAVVTFLVASFLLKLTSREDEIVEKEVARAETAPVTA